MDEITFNLLCRTENARYLRVFQRAAGVGGNGIYFKLNQNNFVHCMQ